MSDREYSGPTLDITAEELRAAGHAIPKTVPDCAWVPRDSVNSDYAPSADGKACKAYQRPTFSQPFRWNELNPGAAPGSPNRVLKREEALT